MEQNKPGRSINQKISTMELIFILNMVNDN